MAPLSQEPKIFFDTNFCDKLNNNYQNHKASKEPLYSEKGKYSQYPLANFLYHFLLLAFFYASQFS
jgi:hypothetical protein